MTDPTVTPPPPAPQPTPYTAAPATGAKTNTLAIIALIAAFVLAPAAIICGHIALGQIKRTGEAGHGLALWGTILGYVFTAIGLLFIVLYFAFFAVMFGSLAYYS